MSKAADPFYTRKPVPDEFIDGVGFTGLTPAQEEQNRERKYSVTGVDVRKFDKSNKFAWHPQSDPFYGRKPVPDSMIQGVGETGLTKEQEYENRERKYSLSGADVRRFDNNGKFSFHPTKDPYYGRKPVHKAQVDGVGETNLSAAQAYEIRENKAALFDLSTDPFQQLTGRGHRASVDFSVAPDASAMARRRSSAIAPDAVAAAAAAAAATAHHHSGYDGNEKLAPVQSLDPDQITPSGSSTGGTNTGYIAGKDSAGHATGETGHTDYYDQATEDDIAPHEKA